MPLMTIPDPNTLATAVSPGAAPAGALFIPLADGQVVIGNGGGTAVAGSLSALAAKAGMTMTGAQLAMTFFAGNVTAINWNNGNHQLATLANGANVAALANPQDGASYLLRVKQPASAAAGTITWPSGTDGVTFLGGATGGLSAVNGAVNFVALTYVYADRQYYAVVS